MKNENVIIALNTLIIMNNDRIVSYKNASDVTEELDLKTMFSKFISTSQKCKQELVIELKTLGGKIAGDTKATGKFFRVWMDVKTTLMGKDREEILNSCYYGEDNAKDSYQQAILYDFEHLNEKQKTMIISQRSLLKIDHDHVKALRSALIEM